MSFISIRLSNSRQLTGNTGHNIESPIGINHESVSLVNQERIEVITTSKSSKMLIEV
jgi:hypothetical protein